MILGVVDVEGQGAGGVGGNHQVAGLNQHRIELLQCAVIHPDAYRRHGHGLVTDILDLRLDGDDKPAALEAGIGRIGAKLQAGAVDLQADHGVGAGDARKGAHDVDAQHVAQCQNQDGQGREATPDHAFDGDGAQLGLGFQHGAILAGQLLGLDGAQVGLGFGFDFVFRAAAFGIAQVDRNFGVPGRLAGSAPHRSATRP